MKYIIALLMVFAALPASAQNTPEPRPFDKGRTTLSQPGPKTEPGQPKEKLRQPNVEIWLPPEFQASERKWPLIIFSHGFGGCAKQSLFLTEFLADHGYIVIAPDHADAACDKYLQGGLGNGLQGMHAGKRDWPEKPFRNPDAWNDKTEADRRDDVLFALSSMLDDRQYKNYVDVDHIGLMGHSLGGYTVLGLAGAWPSWKDKKFKAVLALSPYIDPYIVHRGLPHIGVPVMYQGGTSDAGITPLLKKSGYAQTPAPKYFIEFEGAGHFAWTQLQKDYQSIIEKTALEFFEKYLKEQPVDISYPPGKGKIRTFWKDAGKD